MKRFASFGSLLAVTLLTLAYGAETMAQVEAPGGAVTVPGEKPAEKSAIVGAYKLARVYFIYPKDGDTVPKEFTAKFAVEGLKVANAGEIVPGTGHFHVLIDSPIVPEGTVVPADDKHLHYGKGQTEAKLKLAPGPHTIVLQFADGAHRAYHKLLAQEIKITVK